MNKRQIGTNSKEASRMAGVLQDPRWEKLVSGQATPEEVAGLRAWARESRLARKAWELYRPSFDKEKEAMTATLLRALEQERTDSKKVWRSAKLLAMTSGKPEDRRMMSRHPLRVPKDLGKPGSHEPLLGAILYRSIRELTSRPHDSGLPALPYAALASIKLEPVATGLVGRRDLSGTTSARITLTKDAVDIPADGSFSAVSTPSGLREKKAILERQLRRARFGLVAVALVCAVLCCFTLRAGDEYQSPVPSTRSVVLPSQIAVCAQPPEPMPTLIRIEPESADVAASAAPPHLAPSAGSRWLNVGEQATVSPVMNVKP